MKTNLNDILSRFKSVSLEELDSFQMSRRFDKKYVFSKSQLPELLETVKLSYLILEISGRRSFHYENQYYDTVELESYYAHHNNRQKRYKLRRRYYNLLDRSYLEIKQKDRKGETLKRRLRLEQGSNTACEQSDFISSNLSHKIDDFTESGANEFSRITLVSFDSGERITIDFDLVFKLHGKVRKFSNLVIVEIKSAEKYSKSEFTKTLKALQIRPRKFSKYCMSMALLKPELKRNAFKSNVLYLKKILKDEYIA